MKQSTRVWRSGLGWSLAGALVLAACTSRAPAPAVQVPAVTAPSLPPFQPIATLRELMSEEIDPSADAVWDSVATTVSAAGVDEKQPRTPQQWAAVRRDALRLLEATNLLLIDGRRVSSTPFAAEAQGALDSTQIEQRIDADRPTFNGFAVALRTSGLQALEAIDARDARALLRVGGSLDAVCEACHLKFWYPNQIIPPFPRQAPVYGHLHTSGRAPRTG